MFCNQLHGDFSDVINFSDVFGDPETEPHLIANFNVLGIRKKFSVPAYDWVFDMCDRHTYQTLDNVFCVISAKF